MPVMIGLGVAGLAVGVIGAISAQKDQEAAQEAQYLNAQYKARVATDAANLKRAANVRNQSRQRQELFNASYKEYYKNGTALRSKYQSDVSTASQVYQKTRAAMSGQIERNGLSATTGSGRALAYSAMRQASKQLQGFGSNYRSGRDQLRDRLDAKLSTQINADSPALFIQGPGPQGASSMSNTLGAISGGLAGAQAGISLAQSYQQAFPKDAGTAPGAGMSADAYYESQLPSYGQSANSYYNSQFSQ